MSNTISTTPTPSPSQTPSQTPSLTMTAWWRRVRARVLGPNTPTAAWSEHRRWRYYKARQTRQPNAVPRAKGKRRHCEGRQTVPRWLPFFFLLSSVTFFFFDSFVELQLQLQVQLQSLCVCWGLGKHSWMSSHIQRHTHIESYTTVKTNSGHLGQASSKLKRLEVVENGRSLRSWKLHSEYYILIKPTRIHMTDTRSKCVSNG